MVLGNWMPNSVPGYFTCDKSAGKRGDSDYSVDLRLLPKPNFLARAERRLA